LPHLGAETINRRSRLFRERFAPAFMASPCPYASAAIELMVSASAHLPMQSSRRDVDPAGLAQSNTEDGEYQSVGDTKDLLLPPISRATVFGAWAGGLVSAIEGHIDENDIN
jgi:hypothetical protein